MEFGARYHQFTCTKYCVNISLYSRKQAIVSRMVRPAYLVGVFFALGFISGCDDDENNHRGDESDNGPVTDVLEQFPLLQSFVSKSPPSQLGKYAQTPSALLPYPAKASFSEILAIPQDACLEFEIRGVDGTARTMLNEAILRLRRKFSYKGSEACGSLILFSGDSASDITMENANEEYTLSTDDAGRVTILAKSVYGALHALTTLWQSLTKQGKVWRMVKIEDLPRFKYRGVMIDPVRNFLPLDYIKLVIDAASFVKLNVLHMALTNAEAWIYEGVDSVTRTLAKHGKISAPEQFSADQLKGLVEYARNRGVRVLFEINTPAHSYSWGKAPGYEWMVECNDMESQHWQMCPQPPCGYINHTAWQDAIKVVKSVWGDLYDNVLKGTGVNTIHIGADEVQSNCWGAQTTQTFRGWINEMLSWAHAKGLRTNLWAPETEVDGFDLTTISMKEGDHVQFWGSGASQWKHEITPGAPTVITARSQGAISHIDQINLQASLTTNREHFQHFVRSGFGIIDSNAPSWYLDCGQPHWMAGVPYWCGQFNGWRAVYLHNPTDYLTANGTMSVADAEKSIAGGEVCLWGELIDHANAFPMLFPRASAAAERLWSPFETTKDWLQDEQTVGQESMLERLKQNIIDMRFHGWPAARAQPAFCDDHPDICNNFTKTF